MFCKAAQRECAYLEEVEEFRKNSVLYQATALSGSEAEEEGLALQGVCSETIENLKTRSFCSEDKCGVLVMLIRAGLVGIAREGGFGEYES